jgi:hypothetical protein
VGEVVDAQLAARGAASRRQERASKPVVRRIVSPDVVLGDEPGVDVTEVATILVPPEMAPEVDAVHVVELLLAVLEDVLGSHAASGSSTSTPTRSWLRSSAPRSRSC